MYAVYRKLGYAHLGITTLGSDLLEKKGTPNPRDHLEKYYRIEAIDPKTGKARLFTFPVKDV